MYAFELSKKNMQLSESEVLELLGIKQKPKLIENFLFAEKIGGKIIEKASRLAFTRKVFKLLFDGSKKDLEKLMKNFSWKKIYRSSFALRVYNSPEWQEKDLAGFIWRAVKNPKVVLEDPFTMIAVVFFGKRFFCFQELWKNSQNFEARKPQNRPEQHPSSLDPRLARAMVNLASSSNIIDPFCGAGGILIESALMGLKTKGSDFDRVMINRAKLNMAHFGIKDVKLEQKDALAARIGKSFAIVTDFPYGKNTKVSDAGSLLKRFLEKAKKQGVNKIVIGLNNSMPYNRIIKNAGWKTRKEFSIYIHKSLTKRIVVLE